MIKYAFSLLKIIFSLLFLGATIQNIQAQCAPWPIEIFGAAGGTGQARANYVCDPNEPLTVKCVPDFNGHPGLAYKWHDGSIDQSVKISVPTVTSVTVTDDNGCTASASFEVFAGVPAVVTATASPNPAATGQTVTVTVTGTFQMNWCHLQTDLDGYMDHPFMLYTASETWTFVMGTTDKKVQFQGHDDVGCGNQGDITIKLAPPCTLTASANSTNPKCAGASDGTATATNTNGSSAITYAWSNGMSGASITGLAAGTYSVTATDGACVATATTTLNEPTALALTCSKTDATTKSGTDGTASVSGSGGTGTYTYLWSNNATTASITGLAAGTYKVTVTDANGCTSACSSVVNEPGCNLAATAAGTNPKCNGGTDGTVTLTVTGAVGIPTYVWSNGATTKDLASVGAGTYSVTATDGACVATATITLNEPTALALTCSKTDVTTKSGTDGTASVSGSGGTGTYTYLWSNNATTASITGLAAGTYKVTVTDANGCTSACSSVVNEPGCIPPTVGINTTSAGTCTGTTPNNDAQITFSGFTNADKADRVEATTYTGGAVYSAATLTVTSGGLTVAGLKHNTQYTFRFWNGADACFTDVTITTPVKNCTIPCPTKICTAVKIIKI